MALINFIRYDLSVCKREKKRITQIGRKKSDKVEKKFPPEKYRN